MIVAFDFDNTITVERDGVPMGWNEMTLQTLWNHAAQGHEVIIVTARTGRRLDRHLSQKGHKAIGAIPLVYATIRELNLPVRKVYFTDGKPKGPLLKGLGVRRLYDDNPQQRASAEQHGVKAIELRPGY